MQVRCDSEKVERIFVGMKAALEVAADALGHDLGTLLGRTRILVYGTTHAANAIVEHETARTAFLTTEGFPDILRFREGGKSNPHDFRADYPAPCVPRRLTFEIRERITSEGEVHTPLDAEQARVVAAGLAERGVEAVAVCFLWSIVNPRNELAMAAVLDRRLPGVPYTLSHRLLPIIREYRRASATAIDAALKPLMQAHLRDMGRDLRDDDRRVGEPGVTLAGGEVEGADHLSHADARAAGGARIAVGHVRGGLLRVHLDASDPGPSLDLDQGPPQDRRHHEQVRDAVALQHLGQNFRPRSLRHEPASPFVEFAPPGMRPGTHGPVPAGDSPDVSGGVRARPRSGRSAERPRTHRRPARHVLARALDS